MQRETAGSAARTVVPTRAVAVALVLAIGLAGVEWAAHVHKGGAAQESAGTRAGVPLSVILQPDAPAQDQHWHAAKTSFEPPCTACMLWHQAGVMAGHGGAPPVTLIARAAAPPPCPPVNLRPCPASARAPPPSC